MRGEGSIDGRRAAAGVSLSVRSGKLAQSASTSRSRRFRSWSSKLLEQTRALRQIAFENKDHSMQTGTIKKLVTDRGFGFIAAEDGKEYFFHRSGTEGDFDGLNGGEKVSFEIEQSPKGPRAKSVRIASA